MKAFYRRLGRLEQVVRPALPPPVTAIAFNTGSGDLMFAGGEWLPCPDPAAILDRHSGPLKVYSGFDPRKV